MKKLILSVLVFISICATPCFAANKYVSAAGGNFKTSGTWVTTNGGSTVTTTPTASDVCYATSLSGNLTFDGANACGQFIGTGYTGALDSTSSSNVFTVTTNITISSTTTFGATAFRLKSGAGTSTWNIAVTFPWDFEIGGTGTKTLSANVTVSGITYLSANPTVNTNTWYAVGGVESTTTTNRYFYGSTNLEVKGGRLYYITKRTGGILILNGNITLESGYATSTMGIYDATLRYTSGTITVATDSIFNINGTSTIESNVGSNVVFEHIDATGTLTIGSDIYVAKKMSVMGTTSLTINGAFTIHVGYGGNTGADLIMYNAGTFISTTAKISMEGTTGSVFEGTSYNGMKYSPVSALQIDVDINSPGTITFDPGSANRWGGGRTLTYVAGTVVTTGCTWYVQTGGYTFNIDILVPTFEIVTADTATLSSDFDCTTFRQISGSTLSIATTKTFTVGTNFYVNGTDSTTTTISSAGTGLLDYNGTDPYIFKTTVTNIDASPSAVPIFTWYGSTTGSTNVYAITKANIKTLAYASA